jgi:hypothetical protein
VLGPFDDLEDYANCSDVPAKSGEEDEDKSVVDDASDHNDDMQRELGLEEPNHKKNKRGGKLKDGIWYELEKIASTNNSWECIHCHKTFRCPQADQLRKHIDVNCDVTRTNRNKELVSDLTILSEVSVPSSAGGITSGISKRLLQPSVKTFFRAHRIFRRRR